MRRLSRPQLSLGQQYLLEDLVTSDEPNETTKPEALVAAPIDLVEEQKAYEDHFREPAKARKTINVSSYLVTPFTIASSIAYAHLLAGWGTISSVFVVLLVAGHVIAIPVMRLPSLLKYHQGKLQKDFRPSVRFSCLPKSVLLSLALCKYAIFGHGVTAQLL